VAKMIHRRYNISGIVIYLRL